MTRGNLFFEPLKRINFAVAENNRARLDYANKVQQFVTVRVRGQIKVQHLAIAGDLTGARAEEECFARLGSFQAATRRIGIGVADKKDSILLVSGHASRDLVRRSVL